MSPILFENARVFDGVHAACREGMQVLVESGVIREVTKREIQTSGAVIDVSGRTLMPGLIDAHVHAYASHVNVQRMEAAGEVYRTAHAARMLSHALDCGFTTVRDIGGGDYGCREFIRNELC